MMIVWWWFSHFDFIVWLPCRLFRLVRFRYLLFICVRWLQVYTCCWLGSEGLFLFSSSAWHLPARGRREEFWFFRKVGTLSLLLPFRTLYTLLSHVLTPIWYSSGGRMSSTHESRMLKKMHWCSFSTLKMRHFVERRKVRSRWIYSLTLTGVPSSFYFKGSKLTETSLMSQDHFLLAVTPLWALGEFQKK